MPQRPFVDPNTYQSVGEFWLAWSWFERCVLKRHASTPKIMTAISSEEITNERLLNECERFKNCMLQFAGNRQNVLWALKFRPGTDDAARDTVRDWLDNNECTYQAPIAAIYRIRCNLGHGEKDVLMAANQVGLFDAAKDVLDAYSEKLELLPILNPAEHRRHRG